MWRVIRWRVGQLWRWSVNTIINRGLWKKLWNSESHNGTWEILHDGEAKTVQLHYIPEDDYTDKDVKIELTHEEFEDLIKFLIRIA